MSESGSEILVVVVVQKGLTETAAVFCRLYLYSFFIGELTGSS